MGSIQSVEATQSVASIYQDAQQNTQDTQEFLQDTQEFLLDTQQLPSPPPAAYSAPVTSRRSSRLGYWILFLLGLTTLVISIAYITSLAHSEESATVTGEGAALSVIAASVGFGVAAHSYDETMRNLLGKLYF